MKKITAVLLAAVLLTALSACGRGDAPVSGETLPNESYSIVEDQELIFADGLIASAYPEGSTVGDWLVGCSASDRDDQVDAYVLRRQVPDGENTVFTYLIYYPHETRALTATPALLSGENGYVIELSYEAGTGIEGYSLCYLSFTLPTSKAPRLRLLVEGDTLGVLATVTEEELPLGSQG